MGETTNEVRPSDEFEDPAIRRMSVTSESRTGGTESTSEGGPEAAQIRSDIEHTRADLSETINALQEKLDPTRIAEQVKEQIREKATEAYDTAKTVVKEATIGKAEKIVSNVSEAVTDMTGRAGEAIKSSSTVQYIRDNPIPFALFGIGMGMLALSSRKKQQSSYSSGRRAEFNVYSSSGMGGVSATDQPSIADRARSAASGVADTARAATERATSAVSSAASSVRDAASSAADTARQQLNYVSSQVQQGTRVVGNRYNTMLQENPMALGMVALAAGALVGMVLPSTRVESEYMGEARDRLVDQAKSVAQETVEKVQRVAGEAGQTLKEAAQKEGLMTSDNPTA